MLKKVKKAKAIKEVQIHDNDTGSPEAQTSILSKRIDEMLKHLKKNHKDNHSRRGLLGMVSKRRSLLKYLKKKDEKRHSAVVEKLNLKK
jgi:small subunit ribosomal protein S15